MAANVDKEKCTGCEDCVESCPVEAIKVEDNLAGVDEDACIDCGACESECPNGAISLG